MDMEELTAKSVQMVQKELWAGLAAYNLVRLFMVLAAEQEGLPPMDLSFTQCLRRIQNGTPAWCRGRSLTDATVPRQQLLIRLAQCRLQKRLRFRVEPRALRVHSRSYPPLKGSREEARQRTIEKMRAQPAES